MILETFLTAAVTYASMEVGYWYYQWLKSLRDESLPIVKSLIFAVCAGQSLIASGYIYHALISFPPSDDPIWLASILAARCLYMVPIFRQKVPYATA